MRLRELIQGIYDAVIEDAKEVERGRQKVVAVTYNVNDGYIDVCMDKSGDVTVYVIHDDERKHSGCLLEEFIEREIEEMFDWDDVLAAIQEEEDAEWRWGCGN